MPDQDKSVCPVCGAPDSEPLQTIEKAPVACGSLFPSSESAGQAEMCRLEFVLCPGCSHIWNSAHQDRQTTQYNEDYYSSKAVSQQAQGYQQTLAEDLNRLIGLSGKTVVEIGCGEGLFLDNLTAKGAIGIGYEPSSTFDLARQRPAITVLNRNFDFGGGNPEGADSDVVVMRHVLEHLSSPIDVLGALAKGAFSGRGPKYLFLEVPNAHQILEDNLYFDFYNDHIHYFSHPSLTHVLRRAGWIPLQRLGSEDEFLRVIAVNAAHESADASDWDEASWSAEKQAVVVAAKQFHKDFDQWKDHLVDLLGTGKDNATGIAVWGAGSRGVALLAGLGLPHETFTYMVDSDANKHGRFLPIAQLPIYGPEHLRQSPVEGVLVTSYTYFDEILAQLDWFRSTGGRVIKAYPVPESVA